MSFSQIIHDQFSAILFYYYLDTAFVTDSICLLTLLKELV